MKMRFFTIPVYGGEAAAEELNRFLATGRIVSWVDFCLMPLC